MVRSKIGGLTGIFLRWKSMFNCRIIDIESNSMFLRRQILSIFKQYSFDGPSLYVDMRLARRIHVGCKEYLVASRIFERGSLNDKLSSYKTIFPRRKVRKATNREITCGEHSFLPKKNSRERKSQEYSTYTHTPNILTILTVVLGAARSTQE